MATFQVTPPENFSFMHPEEWPKWIRRFERFRQVSGLDTKEEETQQSMADSSTLDDLLKRVSQNSLMAECSDEHLIKIAKWFNHWRDISADLGLTEAEEEEIQSRDGCLNRKKLDMLRKWKSKYVTKANYLKLADVFHEHSRNDFVHRLCDLILSVEDDAHSEMIKKEAAWGSDVLRYQPSCLQGYDGSEPLEQQFSSQACGVQRQLSSPGSCQYRQTPTGSLVDSDTPKTWEKMPIDTQTKTECMCHLFDLKTSSEDFVKVQLKLAATVNVKKIISIQRVQNTMLYGQYIARKKAMEILNPPGTINESLLFHGTSADTVPKINSQGFNRSFAGRNATAYGIGVYFAVNASFSASPTYSSPDANGHKYMYLVRVLTGEFTVGNSTMIVPPAKNPTINLNVLFDSLVDRSPNPNMYIIFQDAQAYPEYLITFVM